MVRELFFHGKLDVRMVDAMFKFSSRVSGALVILFVKRSDPAWEAQWPHGWYAHLWIELSRFEPWPGTLRCVLGQETLLSQ